MNTDPDPSPRKSGRPRAFDRQAALHAAMLAFWRSGYEGTSIVDLTNAMGINAPSLYGAFGDKQRLFLEAIDHYTGDLTRLDVTIDEAPTARDAVHAMLIGAALRYTSRGTPKGCLLASATASGSSASVEPMRAVAAIRRYVEVGLRRRIERDMKGGLLPLDTDAPALAGLALSVLQGMSVLARDGRPRAALLLIVDASMKAWPSAR